MKNTISVGLHLLSGMFKKFKYLSLFFLLVSSVTLGQNLAVYDSMSDNINIDSLIADSIRKEFILSHNPLTPEEKNAVVLKVSSMHYGNFLKFYMQEVSRYKVFEVSERIHVLRREHAYDEWIFYLFISLLFFLGIIHTSDPVYIRNLFKVYFNQGFIFRQAKELMWQSSLTSFYLNFLFIFSSACFLFFGTGLSMEILGWGKWATLGLFSLVISILQVSKFYFLKFIGWLFQEKEKTESYIFVTFKNAQITGLILLISSLMMAVSGRNDANLLFKATLFLMIVMLFFRTMKGYFIFSRQISLPAYIIVCLALDILPLSILVKFAYDNFQLLVFGLMQ